MILFMTLAAGIVAAPPATGCKTPSTRDEVVVCGRSSQRYRIDRSVLQASRELQAPPPKPPVTADPASGGGCVGGEGQGCTGAGVVPLVGVALAAVKAATLAAQGDDWRDAIRTHEDEYRLYKEAEKRRAEERKPRIGIGLGK